MAVGNVAPAPSSTRNPDVRAAGLARRTHSVAQNFFRIDCSGMRCPQPVLKLAVETAETTAGTVVEIVGDCPTFEKDIRTFCERRKKTLLSVRPDGQKVVIQIQY